MAVITEYIEMILQRKDLTFEQAKAVLDTVFDGGVTEVQIAAFLTAMRTKGETAAELAGLAKSLRDHAICVEVDGNDLIDTCGTGGAAVKTFNISTAAALVAAGAGARVAKHGNRAITSKCGSADVLAELGVKIDAGAEVVEKCIEEANIGFMFAPMFHPAMKFVQPVRKALEFRTVFNILGPLANPAAVTAQLMGVASEELVETICETLKILGAKRAMVVHSRGMDEIGTFGSTLIRRLVDGEITSIELAPAEYGFDAPDVNELKSGDAAGNARIIREILTGRQTGPRKDVVVLNAAAAIIVAGLADDFESAVELADASVISGRGLAALEKLIEVSNKSGESQKQ